MYCLITNYYILFQQWHCALLHITPQLPSTQNSEVGDSEEVLLLHIIWKHSSTLARTKNALQQWSMHSKETHVQMMRNWQISWSGSSLKHTSLANREMQNKMIGNDKIQLNTLATRNCIVPPTGIVNETIEHLFRNKCLCHFSWWTIPIAFSPLSHTCCLFSLRSHALALLNHFCGSADCYFTGILNVSAKLTVFWLYFHYSFPLCNTFYKCPL